MNDKILLAQNLRTDGRVSFDGLYDIDDNSVSIVIDKSDDEVILLIYKDIEDDEDDYDDIDSCDICEDCLREECSKHDDCDDCPISHCCERMFEDDEGLGRRIRPCPNRAEKDDNLPADKQNRDWQGV